MLLIIKVRDVIQVFYNNKLPFVLVIYEIAVKASPHALRHLVIYPIIKTVKRRVNDKDVRIKLSILYQKW